MNPAEMFIAALILTPAIGLMIWVWFAMTRFEEQMRASSGFEGMHFEIGPLAADNADRAK